MLMVIWGQPKGRSSGRVKNIFEHTILEQGDKCRYFVAEITYFGLEYLIFNLTI